MDAIDNLVTLLAKLPGVGKKTAGRLSYYILEKDKSYALSLSASLQKLHESIKNCTVCGNWTESDPCPICSNPSRDGGKICVVERAQDIRIIEESREFSGVFHVLGGLIAPLEGVRPQDIAVEKLMIRVRSQNINEVILALNPTVEGDTTSMYIQNRLKEFKTQNGNVINITRLASGLPVGGDLEYADKLTLARSFRGRIKL